MKRNFDIPEELRIKMGSIIKAKREEKNLGLNQLAVKSGINIADLHKIENGTKNKINPFQLKLLGDALKVDYKEFYKVVGFLDESDCNNFIKVEQTTHVIPFYPNIKAAAGRGKLNFDYTKEELEVPEKYAKSNYVACIAEGDSMEPEIHGGDVLILDTHEPSNFNNKIFVVWKNGEIFLKEIIDAGDSIILHSRNGIYKPMHVKKSEIQVIGRVVASYREY